MQTNTTIQVTDDKLKWTTPTATTVWPLHAAKDVIDALRACARGVGHTPSAGVIPGPKGKVVLAPLPFTARVQKINGEDRTVYASAGATLEMTNDQALALADAFEHAMVMTFRGKPHEKYTYALSTARLYEVLRGWRADGTDGAAPRIHVDADTAKHLQGARTFRDVGRDPETVQAIHDRENNSLTIEVGPHLRGQRTTVAAADRDTGETRQIVRAARKHLGKMRFTFNHA